MSFQSDVEREIEGLLENAFEHSSHQVSGNPGISNLLFKDVADNTETVRAAVISILDISHYIAAENIMGDNIKHDVWFYGSQLTGVGQNEARKVICTTTFWQEMQTLQMSLLFTKGRE